MFKLLLSGTAISLIILAGNTQAQVPPITTPTPQSQSTSPTSTPLKATDLPLLNRAIGKFWQTDRAETESQMDIDSSDGKVKTKYLVSVKTIAKVGQKFRSELIINRVGQKSKLKYTIVSDGVKVWVYQPDTRQYTEIIDSKFPGDISVSIIGLSSMTFISPKENQRQDLITDILGENNRIISLENFKILQVRQQQIDKQNFSVYTYSEPGNYLAVGGFINSQTAMFERIELKFKIMDLQIVEKIIKRNSQPVITAKTFTFSPPKGVKKVKSLEIGPFKF